ncbi:MAG: GAF domain-containing protein, partial [Anaerolineae bacterium]|nr:GAF domain-containing protein [Anaerolineae bacterium]
MTSSRFQPFIAMSLLAMTLLVVFSSAGSLAPVMSERFLELVIYALLTAFALALSVPLTHGELSVAHAIGMMAFLSLEASTYPAMSIAIFSGGILGAAALIVRGRDPDGRRRTLPELRQGVYLSARVTLSFYAAARIYAEVLQGPLPLSAPGRDNLLELSAPLALYALIYTIVYLAIYVLQLNSEHIPWQTQLRENGLSILIILLLPVPFALIGADVARADESIIYFTITIVGAVLIISGLYALSHSQERMRRQVIELQSLSVATGMMRGSLDLDSLLKTLYVQISELLDTRSATLALRGSPLTIALVMRQGVEQSPALPPDDVALLQQVLAGGRPLRLDTDSGASLPAGMMSWLGVPLTGSGAQVNGVVAVQSYDSARIFTENDLRLLNIVATSASIAIENARLYTEKSSRAEQLATLNQIAALLTGTLSPGEVLDTIVSSASTISDATGIAVYLYDTAEPPQLQLVRSAGIPADMLPHLAQPLLAARLVPGQRPGPLLISDLAADAETAQLRPALLAQGWQALVELPLTIGDLLPGFIAFFFFTGQPGLREDLDLFQAYATQAAQAIKNARTYETADKALEQRLEQL